VVLGVELDGAGKVLLGALEVLHVERLDGSLLELERLLLALGDRVHHQLELLLGAAHVRRIVLVELQPFLESVTRRAELLHPEEGGAAARVALGPLGLEPDAVVGIGQRLVVLLERHVRGRAVGVEDMVVGVELDRLFEQIDSSTVVLVVERLDGALLGLERLALPRHPLGNRVHDRLELLLQRVVPRVELEAILEHDLRLLQLAHPEVDGAAAEVALGPRGLQPHALVSVLHGLLVLLESDVGRAAVGEEHVRFLVERERDSEVLDRAVILLRLEVVDGDLLERVDGRLDDGLWEEKHLLRVIDAIIQRERVDAAVDRLRQLGQDVARAGHDRAPGRLLQLADVEAAGELEHLAARLGHPPHLLELLPVNAQHVARVNGIVHDALGERLGPRDAELAGEVGELARGRVELDGLRERRLVRDRVIVVVDELLGGDLRRADGALVVDGDAHRAERILD